MKFLFFPTGLDWKQGASFGIAVIHILTLGTRGKANEDGCVKPGATVAARPAPADN